MTNKGKGFFITGTDTGIGKTVVSALLLRQIAARGTACGYMKPVQTGCEGGLPPDPVYCCEDFFPAPPDWSAICPYQLDLPASPHLAAEQEHTTIERPVILQAYSHLQQTHAALIVEGAGGVMVPITRDWMMRDLMQDIGLPVIVVCRAGLGTINHTLLTLAALREADLEIAGLVMVDTTPPSGTPIEADNLIVLEQQGATTVWARMPYQPAAVENRDWPALNVSFDALLDAYSL
jgi:dethiobiotin synthetase